MVILKYLKGPLPLINITKDSNMILDGKLLFNIFGNKLKQRTITVHAVQITRIFKNLIHQHAVYTVLLQIFVYLSQAHSEIKSDTTLIIYRI